MPKHANITRYPPQTGNDQKIYSPGLFEQYKKKFAENQIQMSPDYGIDRFICLYNAQLKEKQQLIEVLFNKIENITKPPTRWQQALATPPQTEGWDGLNADMNRIKELLDEMDTLLTKILERKIELVPNDAFKNLSTENNNVIKRHTEAKKLLKKYHEKMKEYPKQMPEQLQQLKMQIIDYTKEMKSQNSKLKTCILIKNLNELLAEFTPLLQADYESLILNKKISTIREDIKEKKLQNVKFSTATLNQLNFQKKLNSKKNSLDPNLLAELEYYINSFELVIRLYELVDDLLRAIPCANELKILSLLTTLQNVFPAASCEDFFDNLIKIFQENENVLEKSQLKTMQDKFANIKRQLRPPPSLLQPVEELLQKLKNIYQEKKQEELKKLQEAIATYEAIYEKAKINISINTNQDALKKAMEIKKNIANKDNQDNTYAISFKVKESCDELYRDNETNRKLILRYFSIVIATIKKDKSYTDFYNEIKNLYEKLKDSNHSELKDKTEVLERTIKAASTQINEKKKKEYLDTLNTAITTYEMINKLCSKIQANSSDTDALLEAARKELEQLRETESIDKIKTGIDKYCPNFEIRNNRNKSLVVQHFEAIITHIKTQKNDSLLNNFQEEIEQKIQEIEGHYEELNNSTSSNLPSQFEILSKKIEQVNTGLSSLKAFAENPFYQATNEAMTKLAAEYSKIVNKNTRFDPRNSQIPSISDLDSSPQAGNSFDPRLYKLHLVYDSLSKLNKRYAVNILANGAFSEQTYKHELKNAINTNLEKENIEDFSEGENPAFIQLIRKIFKPLYQLFAKKSENEYSPLFWASKTEKNVCDIANELTCKTSPAA